MADFNTMAQTAPHLAHHIPHVAHHVAPVINQGISMVTLFLSNLLTAAVFGGGAWYVRGRGIKGVQNDLNNAKAEISKLTNQATAAVDAAKAVA